MPGIKGMKHRRPRNPKERDNLRLLRIEQMLEQAREGTIALSKSQQFAIDTEYSKLRPSLSAVEQIQQDPRDKGNPETILNSLIAKLSEKPELLVKLVQAVPALQDQLRSLFATNAVQHEPNSTVLVDATSKTLIQ